MEAKSVFLKQGLKLCSVSDYKRALLTGYLCFISAGIGFLYLVYDYICGLSDSLFYYALLLISGFLSWKLNREGKHFLAKIILLMTGNVVVFLSSSVTSLQSDSHLFYLVISLAAYTLFGYESRKTAFAFSLISLMFFVVCFVFDFSLVPHAVYSVEYIRSNRIINFTCVTIITSLILYVLIRSNYQTEETLKEKQEEMELQTWVLPKQMENSINLFTGLRTICVLRLLLFWV